MDNNQADPKPDADAPAPEVDQMKMQMLMQQIRDNQNLSVAVLAGAVAALVGAAVWAAITVATNWQIGFMAIGIGFLVGFYVAMILSLAGIIVLFGTARHLGPKVNRAMLGMSVVALACFGFYQLWLGVLG